MNKIVLLGKKIINKAGFELTRKKHTTKEPVPVDLDKAFVDILSEFKFSKGVSPVLYSTYKSIEYVVKNNIPGDLVECGVAQGTQVMMIAYALMKFGVTDRDIYLYDTFGGMTEPHPEFDFKVGRNKTLLPGDPDSTRKYWDAKKGADFVDWCYCPLDKVKENVFSTGYPAERFKFVKGSVMDTLPKAKHQNIAFLRLDTDFYDSTKAELSYLYDFVPCGGVVTLDDYGAWDGCRKAADEFFQERKIFPMLHRTNVKERVFVKTK